MKKKVQSERFKLTIQDMKKWARNVLLFTAPSLIIFLGAINQGVPIEQAGLVLQAALLNACIDLLKKFVTENY
ncbi:MAG: hypothetical protein M3Q81_04485 [bacterium]|nr:hypothetical protein [bacterium]